MQAKDGWEDLQKIWRSKKSFIGMLRLQGPRRTQSIRRLIHCVALCAVAGACCCQSYWQWRHGAKADSKEAEAAKRKDLAKLEADGKKWKEWKEKDFDPYVTSKTEGRRHSKGRAATALGVLVVVGSKRLLHAHILFCSRTSW